MSADPVWEPVVEIAPATAGPAWEPVAEIAPVAAGPVWEPMAAIALVAAGLGLGAGGGKPPRNRRPREVIDLESADLAVIDLTSAGPGSGPTVAIVRNRRPRRESSWYRRPRRSDRPGIGGPGGNRPGIGGPGSGDGGGNRPGIGGPGGDPAWDRRSGGNRPGIGGPGLGAGNGNRPGIGGPGDSRPGNRRKFRPGGRRRAIGLESAALAAIDQGPGEAANGGPASDNRTWMGPAAVRGQGPAEAVSSGLVAATGPDGEGIDRESPTATGRIGPAIAPESALVTILGLAITFIMATTWVSSIAPTTVGIRTSAATITTVEEAEEAETGAAATGDLEEAIIQTLTSIISVQTAW